MTFYDDQALKMWNTRYNTLKVHTFPCLYDPSYYYEVVSYDDDILIGYQISLFKEGEYIKCEIIHRPCDYPHFTKVCSRLYHGY